MTDRSDGVESGREEFVYHEKHERHERHEQRGGASLLGIYELTEMKLRIQLAKIGTPRPTELVNEVSKLPEGQFLLELERNPDESVRKLLNWK